ncbi:glycoside hydrolase TIM-barrel-like domain-containing protein [Microvirga sp. CF3062]|uniref:glycoside hydrolase family 113 n=1 Tax=Microvirga sp. CF3062 TaxID=3110182 RepID=UPI002E7737E1|nr:glycoside hydrolase TIM-barrel-like domain-containing protein [Microvirga sp. CF3062]MEE1657007.1 glycoside hydrolase TIM-barrel-like domain-containing protein [Microvirga sp. CF3062]
MAKLFDFQAESLPSWWDGNYRNQSANLDLIAGDGASQVVIVPTVYMDSLTSTRVYRDNGDAGGHNTDSAPRTESDASIRVAIKAAQDRGLEVIFKLHVNMQNDDWNALIGPPAGSTPAQAKVWADAWFASYKEAVLHYARLAKAEGVTAFAIGNECESMTQPQYTAYWRDIITSVRNEVGSDIKLTYAATWTEALHVEFWDQLDYMGANPYIAFTSNNANPTVQQLVDGWTKPSQVSSTSTPIINKFGQNMSAMDALKQVAQQFGKKLIFTETGFRSMNLNNTSPWEWGEDNFIDEPEQLNMFKAFYKIITDRADEGWMGGYWLWNYDANQPNPAPDVGYGTDGKLSDAIVEQYFKNPQSVAGLKLDGTTAADRLAGGFNHDTIAGGAGADTLTGGQGGDFFVYTSGDGADTITDFRSAQGDKIRLINAGAAGFDDLQIVQTNGGYIVRFPDGGSLTILTTDAPNANWFTFTAESGPSIKPTAGDDTITGTSKANVINALAGDDTVLGLGGSDRLSGGLGNDTVDGGTGNDVVYGNAGDDYLEGGSGADRIYGGDNSDIVSGGADNDHLRGENGDDMLNGDAGTDLLRGGAGYDVANGGTGHDKLYGEADNDQLSGGEGNDLVNGGSGDDNVEGNEGDDKLYGGDGKDVVEGWFGNDQMWGGAGDDVLIPGGGTDKLWGGKGWDKFVVGDGMGKDVIYDFKLKQGDQLIIQGNMNGTGIGSGNTDAEVMQIFRKLVKQVGSNTVIDFGSGDVLTLKNFKASTLQRDDIWFW